MRNTVPSWPLSFSVSPAPFELSRRFSSVNSRETYSPATTASGDRSISSWRRQAVQPLRGHQGHSPGPQTAAAHGCSSVGPSPAVKIPHSGWHIHGKLVLPHRDGAHHGESSARGALSGKGDPELIILGGGSALRCRVLPRSRAGGVGPNGCSGSRGRGTVRWRQAARRPRASKDVGPTPEAPRSPGRLQDTAVPTPPQGRWTVRCGRQTSQSRSRRQQHRFANSATLDARFRGGQLCSIASCARSDREHNGASSGRTPAERPGRRPEPLPGQYQPVRRQSRARIATRSTITSTYIHLSIQHGMHFSGAGSGGGLPTNWLRVAIRVASSPRSVVPSE